MSFSFSLSYKNNQEMKDKMIFYHNYLMRHHKKKFKSDTVNKANAHHKNCAS